MKVLFFGTPEIAREVLAYLHHHGVEIVGVVTKPDRPKGRSSTPLPPPVKEWVLTHAPSVPLFQPEKASSPESVEALKPLQADLFVVVAYGQILRESLLSLAPLGAINLHASLLPRWRGAAPIQRAIEAGDKESGVTIIRLVQKMDAGPMLLTRKVPLDEGIRSLDLFHILAKIGEEALLEAIHLIAEGKEQEELQDESLATHAAKLTPEGCKVDWNRDGKDIHNLIRAAFPNPIAWTEILQRKEKKKLLLLRSRYREEIKLPPKAIFPSNKEVIIGTAEGSVELLEVQQEGKRAMKAEDWLRGALPDLEFL
jgi:methionyl-tRNA formyltransferase